MQQPSSMDVSTGATTDLDIVIQSFLDSIGNNANGVQCAKKRRRVTKQQQQQQQQPSQIVSVHEVKPGWVPKPSDNCPIVSWVDGDNMYAVQNPYNTGELLLKMELYNGSDLQYMCGLFMKKGDDIHKSTEELIEKVENLWIDKTSGVPLINGLTQTVMQRAESQQKRTILKRRVQSRQQQQQNPTKRRVVCKNRLKTQELKTQEL